MELTGGGGPGSREVLGGEPSLGDAPVPMLGELKKEPPISSRSETPNLADVVEYKGDCSSLSRRASVSFDCIFYFVEFVSC